MVMVFTMAAFVSVGKVDKRFLLRADLPIRYSSAIWSLLPFDFGHVCVLSPGLRVIKVKAMAMAKVMMMMMMIMMMLMMVISIPEVLRQVGWLHQRQHQSFYRLRVFYEPKLPHTQSFPSAQSFPWKTLLHLNCGSLKSALKQALKRVLKQTLSNNVQYRYNSEVSRRWRQVWVHLRPAAVYTSVGSCANLYE